MILLCCMRFFIEGLGETSGERKLLGPVHTNAFSFENASTEDKALELYSLLNEYILACENSRFSSLFATEKAVFEG